MSKYTFNFDYNTSDLDDLNAFIKYCIDDIYPEQDKKVYNITMLYIGSALDKVFLDGKSRTLFSFSDFEQKEDKLNVAFVLTLKSESIVEVEFDIDFNTSEDIDIALGGLKRDYLEMTNNLEGGVNDEFKYIAELMVDYRHNSKYKVGYTNLDKEYDAVLEALIYAMKKAYDDLS